MTEKNTEITKKFKHAENFTKIIFLKCVAKITVFFFTNELNKRFMKRTNILILNFLFHYFC